MFTLDKTNALKSKAKNLSEIFVDNDAFNACLDRPALRLLYPKVQLTSAAHVAELACQARQRHPGEPLHGATMDVSGAYNLVGAKVDYCLYTATRIGGRIVIFLINQWADAVGGDAYGVYTVLESHRCDAQCWRPAVSDFRGRHHISQ